MQEKEKIKEEIGSYPKMADSVEVVSTPDDTKPYFLIKNNRTRKFLKIGKNEYEILSSLDGIINLNDIRQRYKDRFEAVMIDELIARFYHMRLLEPDCVDSEEERRAGVIQRFIMNFTYDKIFKIKINFGDPDQLITKLYGFLKIFFFKPVLITSVLINLYGTVLFFMNFNLSFNVLWEEVTNGEILLLLLPFLAIFFMHEFAHGLTNKHFGGVIYEMGFMFYYFRPAVYCNVTDSYRFSKWRRIAVAGAGIYFQLFVTSLALIAWQISGYSLGLVGRLLVSFAVINMINNIINLIPLIKLDGYWMLTALIDIDNLRQKSFDFLNSLVFNRFLGTAKSNYMLKQSNRKEKIIYTIYGITAIIFTFLIVIIVLIRFGTYLVLRFGRLGFIVFLVMMITISLRALVSILKFVGGVFRGGLKSILRFAAVTALVVAGCIVIFNKVTLDYTVEAMYRLTDAKGSQVDVDTGDTIKIYFNKSDLEWVKQGQNVSINIYSRGVVSRYYGSIVTGNPLKEFYFNTSLNVTANPSLFRGTEKYTLLAEIKNSNDLFKKYKSGTVDILIGKMNLGQYLSGVFQKLLPG
jgi:putative peptide zinc metalloprotease protein